MWTKVALHFYITPGYNFPFVLRSPSFHRYHNLSIFRWYGLVHVVTSLTVQSPLDCVLPLWLCTAPLTVESPLWLWPHIWPMWVGIGNPHDVILTVLWLHSIYLTTLTQNLQKCFILGESYKHFFLGTFIGVRLNFLFRGSLEFTYEVIFTVIEAQLSNMYFLDGVNGRTIFFVNISL